MCGYVEGEKGIVIPDLVKFDRRESSSKYLNVLLNMAFKDSELKWYSYPSNVSPDLLFNSRQGPLRNYFRPDYIFFRICPDIRLGKRENENKIILNDLEDDIKEKKSINARIDIFLDSGYDLFKSDKGLLTLQKKISYFHEVPVYLKQIEDLFNKRY